MFKDFLLDLFLPIRCQGCGKDFKILCAECLAKVDINHGALVAAGADLDGLFVACSNYPAVANYIWQLKYEFVTELVKPLAGLMINRIRQFRFDGDWLIAPIPLHSRRLRERGFNQSELLTRAISRRISMPVVDLLKRRRYTKPQMELDRVSRLANVSGAFSVALGTGSLVGYGVILVDDVYTTGATMTQCAIVLKNVGVFRVYGLVLAQG